MSKGLSDRIFSLIRIVTSRARKKAPQTHRGVRRCQCPRKDKEKYNMKTHYGNELEKLEAVNEINHIILMHIADYGAPEENTLRSITLLLDEVSASIIGRLKEGSQSDPDQG